MASRLDLLRAGLEEVGEDITPAEDRMVRALARMLALATAPKKRNTLDETKLPVPPRTLFEAVRQGAGDKILCEPIDGRWFGRLGGALKALPSFGPEDVDLLVAWINAGGTAGWPQGVPTFSHLITHLDKWTAFARQWDQRGRQSIRGKNVVGTASTAEATDFSAFGVRKLQ